MDDLGDDNIIDKIEEQGDDLLYHTPKVNERGRLTLPNILREQIGVQGEQHILLVPYPDKNMFIGKPVQKKHIKGILREDN